MSDVPNPLSEPPPPRKPPVKPPVKAPVPAPKPASGKVPKPAPKKRDSGPTSPRPSELSGQPAATRMAAPRDGKPGTPRAAKLGEAHLADRPTAKTVTRRKRRASATASAIPSTAEFVPPADPPDLSLSRPAAEASAVLSSETGSDDSLHLRGFLLFTAMPSWLTSVVVHIIGLLVLALLSYTVSSPPPPNELVIGPKIEEDDLEEYQEESLAEISVDEAMTPDAVIEVDTELTAEATVPSPSQDLTAAAMKVDIDPLGDLMVNPGQLIEGLGASAGNALKGRGGVARQRMLREGGGNAASEGAVGRALVWLVKHQNPDGSWSLDHRRGACQGRCGDPGVKGNRVAPFGATSLGLLPFLGAGHTHKEGKYKEVVERGLNFLIANMGQQGDRGSWVDKGGNYYSHGLSTIAVCEAYAMSSDERLALPAQLAVNEIVYAQNPVDGGWRYRPRQAGDTSVVGWQLMALKSAHMAYLNVSGHTIKKATTFLDNVQLEQGSKYRYTVLNQDGEIVKKHRYSMTSVGLLMRMYLGWKRGDPRLETGVQLISQRGPSENDMYYNYYATQVMRHFGGDVWEKWNEKMRDYLVASQSQDGHEKGSWYFAGNHASDAGGRLYNTSLAAMILEVYYRHLPLYQKQAAEDEFPL